MVGKLVKPFRSLESGNSETRKDDIVRAAVTAFVGLTNTTKTDCNQIEDLVLSILPFISSSTKRFVAAALSDKQSAPALLVKRICEEPADICAPLLLRSPVLMSVDLVTIIAKLGQNHARIIAQRKHLPNDVIEALSKLPDPQVQDRVTKGHVQNVGDPMANLANLKPVSADHAREILRNMMGGTGPAAFEVSPTSDLGKSAVPPVLPREASKKLVDLALRDQEGLFVTALADMTGLPYPRTLKLLRRPSPSELSAVLKSFEIDGPTAYLIASVFYPQINANRTETRLFLDRHDAITVESAIDMVRGWKAEEFALTMVRRGINTDDALAAIEVLKAS